MSLWSHLTVCRLRFLLPAIPSKSATGEVASELQMNSDSALQRQLEMHAFRPLKGC
jgi:hypothetical protein